MPITDPILERATGKPQTFFDDPFKSDPQPVVLTAPTGLKPCVRFRCICAKCGTYERLYEQMALIQVPRECAHCDKVLLQIDVCYGYTKEKLPFISAVGKTKMGMNVGDKCVVKSKQEKGALLTSEIAGEARLASPTPEVDRA